MMREEKQSRKGSLEGAATFPTRGVQARTHCVESIERKEKKESKRKKRGKRKKGPRRLLCSRSSEADELGCAAVAGATERPCAKELKKKQKMLAGRESRSERGRAGEEWEQEEAWSWFQWLRRISPSAMDPLYAVSVSAVFFSSAPFLVFLAAGS